MEARSAVTIRPLMSLPMARVRRVLALWKVSDSMTSRRWMVPRSWLGTWMPTVLLPAMRSMRMLSARMARQRSSARPVTREYLTPASGLNSKVVTMGPGLIWTTWPRTSNSAHFSTRTLASSRRSSSRTAWGPSPALSRVLGGSLKPLTFFGATAAVRRSASARLWMAISSTRRGAETEAESHGEAMGREAAGYGWGGPVADGLERKPG